MNPTDEEVAAIVAAIEVCWPRPAAVVDEGPGGPPPWRFSGRWWSRPVGAHRDRSWVAEHS